MKKRVITNYLKNNNNQHKLEHAEKPNKHSKQSKYEVHENQEKHSHRENNLDKSEEQLANTIKQINRAISPHPLDIKVNKNNFEDVLTTVLREIQKIKKENEMINNQGTEYAYTVSKLFFKIQELEKKQSKGTVGNLNKIIRVISIMIIQIIFMMNSKSSS